MKNHLQDKDKSQSLYKLIDQLSELNIELSPNSITCATSASTAAPPSALKKTTGQNPKATISTNKKSLGDRLSKSNLSRFQQKTCFSFKPDLSQATTTQDRLRNKSVVSTMQGQ